MFTGIVERIGIVESFSKKSENALMSVKVDDFLDDVEIGDSISIDGVCQTVERIEGNIFWVGISSETLKVTTFKNFSKGKKVNLEKALRLSSRLGGHILTGHVDETTRVVNILQKQNFYELYLNKTKLISDYIVKKGSIGINGISLTIANIEEKTFSIALIPHTFENTNIKLLKRDDDVNIEIDIFAKYIKKFTQKEEVSITDQFLKDNGFL